MINPCTYSIKTFSYKPKKKKTGLPETVEEFKRLVWSNSKDHLDKYPKWFQKEFMEYWLTVPDTGNKCRYFLLPKKDRQKWSTLGRMATAKRMFYRNDPRFKEEKKEVYKPPQDPFAYYGGRDYQPTIDYEKAKERLKNEPQQRGHLSRLIKQQLR